MKRIIMSLMILACVLFAAPSYLSAGGPFYVDVVGNTGVACRWINNKLTWVYDDGALSSGVSNSEALGWVRDAMTAWDSAKLPDADGNLVQITNLVSEEGGSIGENIKTVDELYAYLDAHPDTPGIIVFDEDGTITSGLGYDSTGILGISQPLATDDSGLYLTSGIVILNGNMLSLLESYAESGIRTAEDLYKAALTHEIGHLKNLDHTQTNYDLSEECKIDGTCDTGQWIATMYPTLKTHLQESLAYDDKITISWIHPHSDLTSKFCTIKGEIKDRDGNPLQGVNVYARYSVGETSPNVDVRSMVSGALYDACVADGHYYLYGIIPNRSYTVQYEPLAEEFTGSSGFEPLPNPPSGFESGIISKDGETTVKCEEGGNTIEMDAVQIDVANPCTSFTEPGTRSETEGTSESGGGSGGGSKCSLNPMSFGGGVCAEIAAMLSSIAVIAVIRRKFCRKKLTHPF